MFLRLLILLLFLLPANSLARERLVVFAAASQADAMQAIEEVFEKQCDCDLVFSFAASSVLARQIEAGANADIFLSASIDWVDWLEEKSAVQSRMAFISNRLVLISGGEKPISPETLVSARFSMADPRSVPAGIYAREALSSLELWEKASPNAVYTENVRIALSMVIRGDLLAGIVYQSDLYAIKAAEKPYVYAFPQESHSQIEYVATSLKDRALAKDFIVFLQSDTTQAIYKHLGFLPLADRSQSASRTWE